MERKDCVSDIDVNFKFLEKHFELMKIAKEYIKEQKEGLQKNYPEELNGILILNYLDRVFFKHIK